MKSKNLNLEAPRSPRERLGNYVILARMLDKGRASIDNVIGEYKFNCSLDNRFLDFKGINADQIKSELEKGLSDAEILTWLENNGTPRTAEEINTWSMELEKLNLFHNPERKEWYANYCAQFGKNPETTTLFELLEADDLASFSNISNCNTKNSNSCSL